MKESKRAKELVLEQLKKTPIVQIMCEKIGISRVSFYNWKKKDKEFAKQVDEAQLDGRSLVNDLAESQLINAVKDRNINAIVAWLKHNHPNYKTRVEIEGRLNVIEELSPEQQKLVQKALILAGLTLKKHEQPKSE